MIWFLCVLFLFASRLHAAGMKQESFLKSKEDANQNMELPDMHIAERAVYSNFLEKVYNKMEEKYYKPVSKEAYQKFLTRFDSQLYNELKQTNPSVNFVKWRSAAYLVDELKTPEDIFSALIPPKFAEKFEKKVLGKNVDLGIEGKLTPEGFLITRMEPRSDAYLKGLRVKDVVLAVDEKLVAALKEDAVKELLNPLENSRVRLRYVSFETREEKSMEVVSQEYFKQSVFMAPVNIPGVYCLEVRTFNRKTSEDMFVYLSWIEKQGDTGLILDLRGNPGGPPLAAREISSFFLAPKEDFAYFEGKSHPKSLLDVPSIPAQYHYRGPVVILVDKESGSASELFSGVMQFRGRATIMGTNTAGKVLLKSMFDFEDQSMLLLVTAAGHFPDGRMFSFDGVVPDKVFKDSKEDLINAAALYLASLKKIAPGDHLNDFPSSGKSYDFPEGKKEK